VILGHPVSHSLSPLFQNAALKSAGLQATYDALDVAPEALTGVLHELARAGVAGNVTIPHKEAMAAACFRTTDLATRVGAVNTFWHEKGKLIGDNTDVVGARIAIATLLDAQRLSVSDAHSPDNDSAGANVHSPFRVTLLGAGGAAAAVIVALESFAPVALTMSARTSARAHALAERLNVSINVLADSTDAVREADLVINCTPIGLRNTDMPVAVEALSPQAIVFDLIPRNGDTAWVLAARAAGHVAEDGTRMLIEQGAAAFERWFDMVPDRASMWRSLKPRAEPNTAQRGTNSKAANRLA
jgi:shikimate dehydrogenase